MYKTIAIAFICIISSNAHSITSSSEPAPLKAVKFVDIQRYLGKWYQVATIPQGFQAGCKNSTATYNKLEKAKISVTNVCYISGKNYTVNGTARVVDSVANSKLKVKLISPDEGDYWIIELDEFYQYAVIATPNRKNLWILTRTSVISESLYQNLIKIIVKKHHFNPLLIKRTEHS
ncbi:lipocalin family protein [bacterium]|nr:lipocalin family protein [bacterium]